MMIRYCRVLLKKTDGAWVAQGLEYDIAAQGRTHKEAVRLFGITFRETIRLHEESGYAEKFGIKHPLAAVESAPESFFKEWEEGLSVAENSLKSEKPFLGNLKSRPHDTFRLDFSPKIEARIAS